MVKIGRQKNRPNTLVSASSVRRRTLAEKVYWSIVVFGHDTSSFRFDHGNKYISNHAVGKRTMGKETGHTLAEKVSQ